VSTATDDEPWAEPEAAQVAHTPHTATKALRVGWGVYQQVAGGFSAFGMLALVAGLWHIGMRGFLKNLVAIWDQTVRPATAFVMHGLVTVPLSWVHVHVEVPLAVRDYLSVGLVMALSFTRVHVNKKMATSLAVRVREWRKLPVSGSASGQRILFAFGLMSWPPALLLTWPLMLAMSLVYLVLIYPLALLLMSRSADGEVPPDVIQNGIRAQRRLGLSLARAVAPLLYLGVLLAINHWLLG
jgi:hypothetical protein